MRLSIDTPSAWNGTVDLLLQGTVFLDVVLTGLSARSYGRFADFVTRIAAGRVERGLPHTLRKCGYKTFTLYPMYGAFLSARYFQTSAGIQNFHDSETLGAKFLDPDSFYFDKAADIIEKQRKNQPLFLLVYTAQNHFPWDFRFRPDLAPGHRPVRPLPPIRDHAGQGALHLGIACGEADEGVYRHAVLLAVAEP